ncbi:uncharacterized protein LOC114265048 [Camellia sinensis]|uniref:uncharacterized protein LOC114265048 n=1 Tax=Camellia sinensis TaxID=4442 RepID=UPI00103636C3|nr:uncharacterized protein LOC114265048 [Camellia sinensis]
MKGGWIPVVKQRRRGGAWDKEVRRGLHTIFVDNLPRSMDAKSLFKLFSKFGVVSDVFIPFKRRRVSNSRFGFVRFGCPVASDVAIQKANGLLVDDKVLAVNMASYDRNNRVIQSQRRVQNNRGDIEPTTKKGQTPFVGSRTFAQVLKGGKLNGEACTTIKANEDGHGWLYDSVIIRLKLDYTVNSIREALEEKGISQVVVRKGGGRDVVVTFNSQEEMQSNVHNLKVWFKEWSNFVLEWQPGLQIQQERCVWLSCFGIPLNLWNRSTLNNIGSLWGSVLSLEGDVNQTKSFSSTRIKVVTSCMGFISSTINLECKGSLYPILVYEDHLVNTVESPTSSHTEHDDCISIVGVGPITFPQKSGEEKADDVAMAHGDRRLTQCNSGEQSDTVVEQDDTVVEETF